MTEGTEKRNPAIELTLNQQSLAPLLAKNQAERLALAARWNADSLPGRLPVELVYEILKICAEFGWTYDYRWIRVTHFCRRWRHIALSTPALWTTIYITHTPLVKLFLKRSGSLLLDVRGRASFDFLEERQGVKNCRNIVGASQRIRSFHLSVDDSDYINDPGEFFNLGRPNYLHLRSLEIDFRLGRSCDVPKMVSDGETMPALENLALEYASWFSARPLMVPTLRSLSCNLRRDFKPDEITPESPHWMQLRTSLSRLSRLERLSLSPLPPLPTSSPPTGPSRAINLPALEHLDIASGSLVSIARFLDELEGSPGKLHTVMCTELRGDGPPNPPPGGPESVVVEFADAVRATLRKSAILPVRSVCIFLGDYDLQFSLAVCPKAVHPYTRRTDPHFQFKAATFTPSQILTKLVATLPLNNVRHLEVTATSYGTSEVNLDEAAWCAACSRMDSLEELEISTATSTQTLLNCLVSSAASPPLLPHLHIVTLRNIDFGSGGPGSWFAAFRDVLERRALCIDSVVIRDSRGFSAEHADIVRDFVGSLDWDGITEPPIKFREEEEIWDRDSSLSSDEEVEADI